MFTRPLAYLVAALVAIGATVWALRLFTPSTTAPAPAPTNTAEAPPPVAPAPAPALPSAERFKLVGVMASGATAGGRDGLALIAVDGQPARTFRVGETVGGDVVVRAVSANGATLGPRDGGAAMALAVSAAPAPAPVPAPLPTTLPPGKVFDGSPESLEVLRKAGSRHPPIPQQNSPAPKKPGEGTAPAGDDGSWRPPSGQ